jgi:hypothetical protein
VLAANDLAMRVSEDAAAAVARARLEAMEEAGEAMRRLKEEEGPQRRVRKLFPSPSELLVSPSELLASPSEFLTSPSELLVSPSELLASPSELLASPSEF